jgi:ATP-dependent DNA helicase RecG
LNQLPQNLNNPIAAVAIDEQHKFGVEQRQVLVTRNPSPHLFNLTATPIPRTLALGIFGEVSITTLSQKPKNRLPVKTWVVSPSRYQKSTSWIKDQLASGSKIFVVCPLIHESEKSKGAHGVEKIYQEYQKKYQMNSPIFMIHGEMTIEKIGESIASFKKAKQAVLVSTSIIEVGIDIPEADVIIIHSAERFGLASLHQLRGRVGRGERQSYCLLVPSKDEQEEEERLVLLETHHSGLKLSKMDLRLRGSGELFGTRQHGWLPVRLKNFWNKKLFGQARRVALDLIAQNEKEASTIAKALLTW